jgi:hypothetical protein
MQRVMAAELSKLIQEIFILWQPVAHSCTVCWSWF